MPDFIDRLGAELRHAANSGPLPPASDAVAEHALPPVSARLSTVPGFLSIRHRRRAEGYQVRRGRMAGRSGLARRPTMFLGSGIAILAAVIAVVILAAPATQPAYAVTQNSDGTITVTIHDLATAVPALNARLAAIGADTKIVPVQANCATGSPALGDTMMVYPHTTATDTITIGTSSVQQGYTDVVAAEQLPNGEVAMVVESIKPPVPSCFATTAYTLQNTGRTINGTPIYQFVPVNPTSTPTSAYTSTTAG